MHRRASVLLQLDIAARPQILLDRAADTDLGQRVTIIGAATRPPTRGLHRKAPPSHVLSSTAPYTACRGAESATNCNYALAQARRRIQHRVITCLTARPETCSGSADTNWIFRRNDASEHQPKETLWPTT